MTSAQPQTARAERRAMIALVTVFALLVQAFIPGLASARPSADPLMAICTDMGLAKAPADSPAAPADHGCKHCLCPAPAAAPPAVDGAPSEAVRYVTPARPAMAATLGLRPGRGLAAPPPPPRGPPAPNA